MNSALPQGSVNARSFSEDKAGQCAQEQGSQAAPTDPVSGLPWARLLGFLICNMGQEYPHCRLWEGLKILYEVLSAAPTHRASPNWWLLFLIIFLFTLTNIPNKSCYSKPCSSHQCRARGRMLPRASRQQPGADLAFALRRGKQAQFLLFGAPCVLLGKTLRLDALK